MTADVINLADRRDDVEHWHIYLFRYEFEGHTYGFQIPARNAEEAERRIQAIAAATYDGQL